MTDLVAHIAGYASIFNAPDMNDDIVAAGAFRAALKKRRGVKMLYQHAVEAPIGRWTLIAEDAKGLFVEGELLLSSERAREVYALLSGGAIDGLSIGFQTVRATKDGAHRVILEADLWEVSVVTFPMAAGARVTRLSAPEEASSLAGALDFAHVLRGAAAAFAVETKQSPLRPLRGHRPRERGRNALWQASVFSSPVYGGGVERPSRETKGGVDPRRLKETIRNLSK